MSKAIRRIETAAGSWPKMTAPETRFPRAEDTEDHVHDALNLSWMDTAGAVAAYLAKLAQPHIPAAVKIPAARILPGTDEDDGMFSHRQETGAA